MKKKPKIDPTVHLTLEMVKARGCFVCDGSRRICNICGESARACHCEEEDFSECENCKPEGKADK